MFNTEKWNVYSIIYYLGWSMRVWSNKSSVSKPNTQCKYVKRRDITNIKDWHDGKFKVKWRSGVTLNNDPVENDPKGHCPTLTFGQGPFSTLKNYHFFIKRSVENWSLLNVDQSWRSVENEPNGSISNDENGPRPNFNMKLDYQKNHGQLIKIICSVIF